MRRRETLETVCMCVWTNRRPQDPPAQEIAKYFSFTHCTVSLSLREIIHIEECPGSSILQFRRMFWPVALWSLGSQSTRVGSFGSRWLQLQTRNRGTYDGTRCDRSLNCPLYVFLGDLSVHVGGSQYLYILFLSTTDDYRLNVSRH